MITREKLTSKPIATKLPPLEIQEINELVESGMFISSADFVREAIRDKLKSIKLIKNRDIDYDIAKKEVLGYYKSYSEAYISQVAEDLELDLELVSIISNDLIKEGRLGE